MSQISELHRNCPVMKGIKYITEEDFIGLINEPSKCFVEELDTEIGKVKVHWDLKLVLKERKDLAEKYKLLLS